MVNYKVLVTGSRDWTDYERIKVRFLLINADVLSEEGNATTRPEQIILHSGACPTGADNMAEKIAAELGWTVIKYPAKWDKYGKRAGFVRNEQMVKLGADVCLAFIKNESKGASMTARLAEAAGIPTVRYTA